MGNAVFDPENYCPICGIRLSKVGVAQHDCDKTILSRIDAALIRDTVLVRSQSLAERLKDGFEALSDDEIVDRSAQSEPVSHLDPCTTLIATEAHQVAAKTKSSATTSRSRRTQAQREPKKAVAQDLPSDWKRCCICGQQRPPSTFSTKRSEANTVCFGCRSA